MARVLVVDDDPGTLETFAVILRRAGHIPALAATGEQGLRLARDPTPDLILTDLRLPDIGGIDVIKRLRLAHIDGPLVIMTGFASIESAVEAGKLGVADYVAKPISDEDLLHIVSSHARREEPVAPGQADEASHINPHVARALKALEEHYREPKLSVRSVATSIGITTEYLCRLIKQDIGHTFQAILIRTRVSEARRLLETTTLSVKEIADRVGFLDTSRLDHCFRTVCNLSPGEYRHAASKQRRSEK